MPGRAAARSRVTSAAARSIAMSSGMASIPVRLGGSVLTETVMAGWAFMQLFPTKAPDVERLRHRGALDKAPRPYAGLPLPERRLRRVDSRSSDCPGFRQGGPRCLHRPRLPDQRARSPLGAAAPRRGGRAAYAGQEPVPRAREDAIVP